MKEKIKAFYRAFLLSFVVLICPIMLIGGMITADINTKQVYNNQTVKVIEIKEDGNIAFMGKTIDKKYLEWTKYPAYVGKQLVPKTIDLVLNLFRKNKKLLN